MKTKIKKITQCLLDSALSRETEQGVMILRRTLVLLSEVSTKADLLSVLSKLNSAMAGIEAHGYFTNEEYECVKDLRRIEGLMNFSNES